MKKNRFFLTFLLPFLGAIPIMIVGGLEEQIVGWVGREVWTVFLVIALVLVFGLSMFPFIKLFKGMFGGKGYNFFWGSGKLAKQILVSGNPARAVLKKIGENSEGGITTINDQPLLFLTLLVDDGRNQPYEVGFDTIVPRTTLSQLQPGVSLPVKVDKYDKTLVVFDQDSVVKAEKPVVGGKNWTEEDHKLLEQSGIDAMALLVSMEDTGKSEDFKILAAIKYEVSMVGKEPYLVEKEIPVPSDMIFQMRSAVGRAFKARVHPYDPQKISVDITF